jgi:ABC-type sugar transport system substrate-binding protein
VTTRSRWATLALLSAAAFALSATAAFAAPYPIPAGYKGVESTLPREYKVPAKQAGAKCTFGFQSPIAANESLGWWQKGFTAQAKALGCKVIALDDALSPDKQVSNMQQLLAQGAQAIIFYPLDPKATTPVLQQAQKQKVPVVAIDASFGNTKKVPLIATQVWQGRDVQAFLQAQVLAKAKPSANLGLIGIGIPVPAIKYFNGREAFWAQKIGKATVLGTQDNPSDDVTGGEKAANALLQRFSNVDAVIGYNDPSALGAVVASKGAGKTLTIIGCNGTSDGLAGIKNGTLAATVQVDPIGIGVQTARASYSLITKQHLPLPGIVIRPGRLVTKANVGSLPSWDAELKAVK